MKEYNLNENAGNLPAEVGVWGKVKNFLFQEIDLNKPIALELTPKEEKVLTEEEPEEVKEMFEEV